MNIVYIIRVHESVRVFYYEEKNFTYRDHSIMHGSRAFYAFQQRQQRADHPCRQHTCAGLRDQL